VRERVVSAAVLVPVVVIFFLLGTPWLTIAVAVLALAAATETFRLLRAAGLPVSPGIGVIAAPLAVLGTLVPDPLGVLPIAFVVAVLVFAAVASFRHLNTRLAFLDWAGSSFGALYVSMLAFVPAILDAGAPFPLEAQLGDRLGPGRAWLLVLVLGVWAYDTAAYLAGRTLGRGPFMRHISPGKTWSGVIGGAIGCVVVTTALGATVPGSSLVAGVLTGLVIAAAAQAGDLAESVLKRAAGVKDSGALLPGHGGVLDRVDSFLFAAPATYVVFALFGPLVPSTLT
jgi:phosphatidate cytidylyltransferase